MRICVLIFLFISCYGFLFSQIPGPDPLSKPKKMAIKKNKVSTSCSKDYLLIDGKEVEEMGYDSMIYDKKGNLIREAELIGQGGSVLVLEISTYTYDKHGRVTEEKMVNHDKDGVVEDFSVERYLYDKKGKLVKSFIYYDVDPATSPPDDTMEYIYEKGRLVKINNYQVWGNSIFEYKNDTLFEYRASDKSLKAGYVDGRMIFHTSSGRWDYAYNTKGLIIRSWSGDPDHPYDEFIWEYENDLPIKITVLDGNNRNGPYHKRIERYTYTYYE